MVNALAFNQTEPEIRLVELPDDDVKWCTVSLADITDTGMRLEASVFDIELKKTIETLKHSRFKLKSLIGNSDNFATAYRPGICKRIFVKEQDDGIPMFTPSQVIEVHPKAEKFLSKKMMPFIGNWFIKQGELLLTCSGTIGKVTLVTRTLDGKCISQNLIRISSNETNKGYLYAFFNTKLGQALLTRNNYGAVIQHIDPEHLINIFIPNPSDDIKKRINNLIIRSFEFRDTSNELIDKAISYLIAELKLPPINEFKTKQFDKKSDVDNYTVRLSNLSGRLDGSYHVPIVNAMADHLKKFSDELITVGDKRVSKEIILPGRFKRIYVEEGQGRVFFGGKQLFELDPSNKKYLSLAKHSKRIKDELEISENTILITRSGTVGKVVIAPKHWEHWIASDHIIRVVPANDNIAGYIYIFLSSVYGYHLIKRYTYGSVVDEIDDYHVSQIPFPLLKDKSIQNEINKLALEANKMRYEAYVLEQMALNIINDEVIYAKKGIK
jgi:type I restriction enzyme S subunit